MQRETVYRSDEETSLELRVDDSPFKIKRQGVVDGSRFTDPGRLSMASRNLLD
jgi:hypothetical protein